MCTKCMLRVRDLNGGDGIRTIRLEIWLLVMLCVYVFVGDLGDLALWEELVGVTCSSINIRASSFR